MKKAHFLPRALILFLVFLAMGVGILRFSTHHYKNIADWVEPDSAEALLYEGETYHLAGEIGESGLSSKKFPTDKILGEVTPESFWKPATPFVVWSVEGKANFLIVKIGNAEDEKAYLYYRDGVSNPAETETAA